MIVGKVFVFTIIKGDYFITAHTVKFDFNLPPFIQLRIKGQRLYCKIYVEINNLKGSVNNFV